MANDYAMTEPSSSDAGDTKTAARWIGEIEAYERAAATWSERASKITKIYLDEHRNEHSKRRFALLWSNIETLKPAIYARPPVAVVSRRYKDADPAGRKASEVLERAINTTFDLGGFDEVMRAVRDDRLLAARGQAWVRYEADFEPVRRSPRLRQELERDQGFGGQVGEGGGEEAEERLAGERVAIDHVHWSDFGHTLDRTWREVRAVWRKVYLTRAEVEKRFGATKAKRLSYSLRPDHRSDLSAEAWAQAEDPQACIYEIWDRIGRKVIWLAREEKCVLESGRPPLDFRKGFPCPEPCYGTKATKSLIPIPDYRYYQDQAEEIDDLTEKIAVLVSWLRLRGLIPGGASSEGGDAIKQALTLEGDQVFVTLESWTGFAEKGGARGLVEWLPLDLVTTALREAIQARAQLINDVYQITGISDILRGDTNPYETLGAQELKVQSATRRLRTAQQDMARFARDISELVGEVIAEQFQPETIAAVSGIELATVPPPELVAQVQMLGERARAPVPPGGQPTPEVMQAQQALLELQSQLQEFQLNAQVVSLLRDDRMRGFRVEIATDSTIEPDEQAEKQSRIEFLTTVGGFVQQVQAVLGQAPILAPLVGEMMMFMVRGFRAGRSMEDAIEQTMAKLQQQLSQPQPNPQIEAELAMKREEHQQKMEIEREKFDFERDKLALPRRQDLTAVIDEQRVASAQIVQALAQITQMLGTLEADAGAPAEIIRDVAGRAVGIRKGSRTMNVTRDVDGRAVGLQ